MASKRTALFLDAQNYVYELNQRWLEINDLLEKHEAENGKDATYYILLGRQAGIKDAHKMAEEFASGKYAPKY